MIGAIIIIGGLYLVLWGKSKEYNSQPTFIEKQVEASKIDVANNEKDSFDHQGIIIDADRRETSIRDEKLQEKSDSIPPV